MFSNAYAIVCAVLLVYIGSKIPSYLTAHLQARRFRTNSTVPCVTIYNPRDSFLFWIISPWVAPYIEALPFGLGHWCRYAKKDFMWASKGKLHREELGSDVWWTVGYGGPGLWVSDADVLSQITHRWRDFPKPVDQYEAIEIFGPNVVTTEGSAWQRHRKITGPPFNERNSNLVFVETLAQGKAMLASFTHDASGEASPPGREPIVEDILHWTMALTLNVISGAAFNLQVPWLTRSVAANEQSSGTNAIGEQVNSSIHSKTHTMDFQTSVDLVMNHTPALLLIPVWVLRNSPLKLLRDLQRAKDEFAQYIHELISGNATAEATTNSRHSSVGGDLLTSMIKASGQDKGSALSEQETIGNIFVFVLAGHETTATTLQTALILLAANPELQQEVQKEISDIWATKSEGEDLSYEDYPKMRVIMALMLETLRLYPPVVSTPKCALTEQILNYRGQSVVVPAGSMVTPDIVSVQRNPIYWGPEAQEFQLSRWLMPPSYVAPPNTSNESTAHPGLLCPTKCSFLAFSGGFRACLGKKFAQVEFCTLIATLLKDHSVELVPEAGASWEQTRAKALKDLDNRVTQLAMKMRKKVKVRFVRQSAAAEVTKSR